MSVSTVITDPSKSSLVVSAHAILLVPAVSSSTIKWKYTPVKPPPPESGKVNVAAVSLNTNVSPESFAVKAVSAVVAVTGVLRPYTLAFVCDVLPITSCYIFTSIRTN